MKNPVLTSLAVAVLAMSALSANAADANVTGGVIYGTGNSNGGFTVNTNSGVEVGLRAHQRFPSPSDNAAGIGSNNNGTYNQATGAFTSSGVAGGTRAAWNFDWSINTGTAKIGDYTYLLGLDFDPTFGVNYQSFDPLASFADHAFDNTGDAAAPAAATAATFAGLKLTSNLVQQSWNYDFFDSIAFPFDPNANGNYSIFLRVIDGNLRTVAESNIEVIVGTGYVPEPGSLALVGLAMGGLAFVRRRKLAK